MAENQANHSEQNPAAGQDVCPPPAERIGLLEEFWLFMKENKAYWLAPIIIVALALIALVLLGGMGSGAAAPFIYTLF